jgi:hypothetical protein
VGIGVRLTTRLSRCRIGVDIARKCTRDERGEGIDYDDAGIGRWLTVAECRKKCYEMGQSWR